MGSGKHIDAVCSQLKAGAQYTPFARKGSVAQGDNLWVNAPVRELSHLAYLNGFYAAGADQNRAWHALGLVYKGDGGSR